MGLKGFAQPDIIEISDSLRLRKYDGHYELFLSGYQDPAVYKNSEGIFDERQKPDLNYVKAMCEYLEQAGELYFIEVKESGGFMPIGDVTIKPENPPIAIWKEQYRGAGIGTVVMKKVIARLKTRGFRKIEKSTVYNGIFPLKSCIRNWVTERSERRETSAYMRWIYNGSNVYF